MRYWSTGGSSPLTRGKLAGEHGVAAESRLIPAHAGKTIVWPSVRVTSRAHPRSRGENATARRDRRRHHGSSPLTRGKRVPYPHPTCNTGLIPAHAGKTLRRRSAITGMTAHPRSRGENASLAGSMPNAAGSSPLTRGKQVHLFAFPASTGLIPAHAGKTPAFGVGRRPTAAHPRSRGENRNASAFRPLRTGSSPLTRGKRLRPGRYASVRRLIPAHAGKTP